MFRVVANKALGVTTITYQGREIDLMKPFTRITIADAIQEMPIRKSPMKFS